MSMRFTAAQTPDADYEAWRTDWTPPVPRPIALPGKVIVEFGPYGTRGAVLTPEAASNNAMVVSDGYEPCEGRAVPGFAEGYLGCGTEVMYTGTTGTGFEYRGRNLMVVPRAKVEAYIPEEAA